MQEDRRLRARILRPVFAVADTAFGLIMLGLVGSYMLRKYAEYVLTGVRGRSINAVHPSIRRRPHKNRRPSDGTSY